MLIRVGHPTPLGPGLTRPLAAHAPDSVVLGEPRDRLPARPVVKPPMNLTGLRQRLERGQSLDKATRAELVTLAHGDAHPLRARLALVMLEDHAEADSVVELWQNRAGDPAAYLVTLHQRLLEERLTRDPGPLSCLNALHEVLQHLEQVPMSHRALGAVCHLWDELEQRAQMDLTPEIRAEEPPEADRAAADRCRKLVQSWLQSGQAQGELTRQAAVVGTRILPRPPQDLEPTAALLARGVAGTREGEELARSLTGAVDYQVRNLVPLLGQDQVGPSYAAAGALTRLLEEHPESVGLTMTEISRQARGIYLPAPTEDVVKAAARSGWKPTGPDEVGWVAGKLFQARGGMDKSSLMREQDEFMLAYELVKDASPATLATLPLNGKTLPGAALDHLLEAGTNLDRVLDLWDHSLGEATGWLLEGQADQKIARLEQAFARAGSFQGLKSQDKALLALLRHADLSPGQRQRLDDLFLPQLERQPAHRLERSMLDEVRLRQLALGEKELAGLPAEQQPACLERLLRLNHLLSEEMPEPSGYVMADYQSQEASVRSAPLVAVLKDPDSFVEPALARWQEPGQLTLLVNLAENRPELSERLFRVLQLKGTVPSVAQDLVDRWCEREVTRAVKQFKTHELPERLASLDAAHKLAASASRDVQRELSELLQGGFREAADCHPVLKEIDSIEVMRELATDPAGWRTGCAHYEELGRLLKEPEELLSAYRATKQAVAAGSTWQQAYELALRKNLHAPDRSPGGSVEISGGRLTVGGVVVRGRRPV